MSQPPFYRATGTINVACFVQMDPNNPTTGDYSGNCVIQATLNTPTVGISDIAGSSPPLIPYVQQNPVQAAIAGQNVRVHGLGQTCLLTAGATGWSAGAELQADANGNGIPILLDGKGRVGAIAIEGCNPGEFGQVQVVRYDKYGSPS